MPRWTGERHTLKPGYAAPHKAGCLVTRGAITSGWSNTAGTRSGTVRACVVVTVGRVQPTSASTGGVGAHRPFWRRPMPPRCSVARRAVSRSITPTTTFTAAVTELTRGTAVGSAATTLPLAHSAPLCALTQVERPQVSSITITAGAVCVQAGAIGTTTAASWAVDTRCGGAAPVGWLIHKRPSATRRVRTRTVV